MTRYQKNSSLTTPPYEWCEIVKDHKRNSRYDEALVILEGCMRVEEAHSGGVAPWYYEHAAIIHRKRQDRDAELAVLRRYAAQQHAPGATPPKLLERLARTRNDRHLAIGMLTAHPTLECLSLRSNRTLPERSDSGRTPRTWVHL